MKEKSKNVAEKELKDVVAGNQRAEKTGPIDPKDVDILLNANNSNNSEENFVVQKVPGHYAVISGK